MSKGYQNWASEVACFIDFDFTIFAMFKASVLLIAGDCLKLDKRRIAQTKEYSVCEVLFVKFAK